MDHFPPNRGPQRHIRRRRMMAGSRDSASVFDASGGATLVETVSSPTRRGGLDTSPRGCLGEQDSSTSTVKKKDPLESNVNTQRMPNAVVVDSLGNFASPTFSSNRRDQRSYIVMFAVAVLGMWYTTPALFAGASSLRYLLTADQQPFTLTDLLGHPHGGPGRAIRLQRRDGGAWSESVLRELVPILQRLEQSSTLLECTDQDLAWALMGWSLPPAEERSKRGKAPQQQTETKRGGKARGGWRWGRSRSSSGSGGSGGGGVGIHKRTAAAVVGGSGSTSRDDGTDVKTKVENSSEAHDRCVAAAAVLHGSGRRSDSGSVGDAYRPLLLKTQEGALLESVSTTASGSAVYPPSHATVVRFVRSARAELSSRIDFLSAEVAVRPEFGLDLQEIDAVLALKNSLRAVDTSNHERYFWFGAGFGGAAVGLVGSIAYFYLD